MPIRNSLFIGFLQFFLIGAAFADERGPCGHDGPKFCEKAKFGKGEMFNCLVTNKAKVSPICREHLNRLLSYRDDCKEEIKVFCGSGRPFYCLLNPSMAETVWKKGSPSCVASLLIRADYIRQCQAEIGTSCSESSSELPKLLACLKSAKTSPACKDELKDEGER